MPCVEECSLNSPWASRRPRPVLPTPASPTSTILAETYRIDPITGLRSSKYSRFSSQIRTAVSKSYNVAKRFFFGLKAIPGGHFGDDGSLSTVTVSKVSHRHRRTESSMDFDASKLPSCEMEMHITESLWPSKLACCLLLARSQISIVLRSDPQAIRFPSGNQEIVLTME